jgi:hypothetical protein
MIQSKHVAARSIKVRIPGEADHDSGMIPITIPA